VTVSGVLVIDKPGGMTSHDVVARVRRALGTRKVGHAGTLDPMATGVLVVGVERATRLLGHLALRDKRYLATIRLGASTVTDDAEGEFVTVADGALVDGVSDGAIRAALAEMVGTIEQRPSSVSAIKVDGRRAHERVRSGEAVDLPARTVVISSLDCLRITRPAGAVDIDIDVECSTGTYVRAIARDVGAGLGVGGHLTSLRRSRLGPFAESAAIGLSALDEAGEAAIVPMPVLAETCFPRWVLDDDEAAAARVGRRFAWRGPATASGPVALVDASGAFLALATDDDGAARFVAVFS
jgi:tRNA pseudouridine55 synthase